MDSKIASLVARVFGYTHGKRGLRTAETVRELLAAAHVPLELSDVNLVRQTIETALANPTRIGSPPLGEETMRTIMSVANSIKRKRVIRPGKSNAEKKIIRIIRYAREAWSTSEQKTSATPPQSNRKPTPAALVKLFLRDPHSRDPNVLRLVDYLKKSAYVRARGGWGTKINEYLTRNGMWPDAASAMERVHEAAREAQQRRRLVQSGTIRSPNAKRSVFQSGQAHKPTSRAPRR